MKLIGSPLVKCMIKNRKLVEETKNISKSEWLGFGQRSTEVTSSDVLRESLQRIYKSWWRVAV